VLTALVYGCHGRLSAGTGRCLVSFSRAGRLAVRQSAWLTGPAVMRREFLRISRGNLSAAGGERAAAPVAGADPAGSRATGPGAVRAVRRAARTRARQLTAAGQGRDLRRALRPHRHLRIRRDNAWTDQKGRLPRSAAGGARECGTPSAITSR